jgi:hypothetical protein
VSLWLLQHALRQIGLSLFGPVLVRVSFACFREFNMMMKIPPHPNVLTLLGGITEWKGQPVYWLVMPYVPGGSLADKLQREPTW